MVGTIASIVYGEQRDRWKLVMAWHVLGGAIGGVITGGILALLHAAIRPLARIDPGRITLAAGSLAILYGLHEGRLIRLPVLQARRQVSQMWARAFRPEVYAFVYGLLLGTGFTSYLHVTTLYAAGLYALLAGGVPALVVMGLFGVGRALPVVALAGLARGRRFGSLEEVADFVDAKAHLVHPLNGLLCVVIGVMFVTMALVR